MLFQKRVSSGQNLRLNRAIVQWKETSLTIVTFPVAPEAICIVKERDVGHKRHDGEERCDWNAECRVDHVLAVVWYPVVEQSSEFRADLGFLH